MFLCVLGVLCVLSGDRFVTAQQDPPRFRASVDVTTVDVGVVDDRGRPVTDLSAADFTVRVDGDVRRVVSAEWVPLVADAKAKPTPVPDGYSSNENLSGGRLIVLAVDQPNIRFGATASIVRAASGFIDKLAPGDRVAIAGIGLGAPATQFTSDRDQIRQALLRMTGHRRAAATIMHAISPTEAVQIVNGNGLAFENVVNRECASVRRSPAQFAVCRGQIQSEASEVADQTVGQSDETVHALRDLFTSLKTIDAPKTVILLSEGFIATDVTSVATELGHMAADARSSVYVLYMDDGSFSSSEARQSLLSADDRHERSAGLEELAAAARGTLLTVTGQGTGAFDQIQSELSGYYLLGIESSPRDRDGKAHPVRIDVPRRGALVRARRQLLDAGPGQAAAKPPRQAVIAALSSPLPMSALPVRVATFTLQGPERDRVQLLIHADIGHDYSAARAVSVGYVITDRKTGRTVDTQSSTTRLTPVMGGVPSALQFVGGASLPPGEYTLKFAAAEGERAGSVEHAMHAGLVDSGNVKLSELMVGGPFDVGELLKPTVGYTVSFGSVHGYVEAYGGQAEAVTVKYEVAADAKSPALLTRDAPGRDGGDDRMIFTLVMPVSQLPPGPYVLRAMVSLAAKPLRTMTRAFEIAPPAVLMASAEGVGAVPAVEPELFLPVDEQTFTHPFSREEAVRAETLTPFLDRVSPTVKAAFETGVTLLGAGDFPKAEASLKLAVQPDVDSTAALAYLAATFAASGHDQEAASAWQTALADGAELPQIYAWLSQSLLRSHNLTEARAVLEEAAGKWPTDTRFTGPLAAVYATFGKGRDAFTLLERYLASRSDDREAFGVGVEWLYQIRAAGRVIHTRAADLKLAQEYASAYGNGPKAALVRQWLDFLTSQ